MEKGGNISKRRKKDLKTKPIVCAALIALAVSLVLLPAAQARPVTEEDFLESKMSYGFRSYLRRLGISESLIYNPSAKQMLNNLFIKFIDENPEYHEYLQRYDAIQNHRRKPIQMPDFGKYRMIIGRLLRIFNTTVDESEYRVEVREAFLQKDTEVISVVKTTFYGNGQVIDPWIYIHIESLRWWIFTYGEDDSIYVHFQTNVNGINEAATFKGKVNEYALTAGILGVILGIVVAVAGGGPVGAIVPGVTTYAAGWIVNSINTGYDSVNGIKIWFLNHYLYTQIGSTISLYTWWWCNQQWHKSFPAPFLDFFSWSMYLSWLLSLVIRAIGNRVGFDRWVQAGVYRG